MLSPKNMGRNTITVMGLMFSCLLFGNAKVYVQIHNRGQQDMSEHCWSRDDDMGVHLLEPGQYHEFSFRPNIWGSTKFVCAVSFGGDEVEKRIMAYQYTRDSYTCVDLCKWYLSETIACHENPLSKAEDCSDFW
uniref:S-protein homolog n=1 Tax=Kalanchoe fedtschenkoi TaxID=63787 RepID=A0A7N0R826_KALFE